MVVYTFLSHRLCHQFQLSVAETPHLLLQHIVDADRVKHAQSIQKWHGWEMTLKTVKECLEIRLTYIVVEVLITELDLNHLKEVVQFFLVCSKC